LNSVYFSPKYRNSCGRNYPDPGADQMRWLSEHLESASNRGEKVWISFHIPPGIDGYATARARASGRTETVYMWRPELTAEFDRLITRYSGNVTAILAGHEHMDDFRLLTKGVVILAPGVSPIVQQNPAYRIASFSPAAQLLDHRTYYLSNLEATAEGDPAKWQSEYSFGEEWPERTLSFDGFQSIYQAIGQQGRNQSRWSTFYSVSHSISGSSSRDTFGQLYCASGHIDDAGYKQCLAELMHNQQ
jgi:sphingomyelin phosphodiesterase acid-like 3